MRIVAGEWRGRSIATLPEGDRTIRPTSDRAREAIFNILFSNYGLPAGAHVLDLCCGTGALGLEALSRGAAHCTFIDNNTAALKLVRDTAKKFGAESRAQMLMTNATNLPPSTIQYRLVFCDPPYNQGIIPAALAQAAAKNYLAPGALLVLETAAAETLVLPEGFTLHDTRRYGAAKVMFVRF